MSKLIALYLPQFHCFKENDSWWGEGYTEWTAVKRARPLFKKHKQPRIPLDNEYYDLVKDGVSVFKKQAKLAKDHGIDAFCFYSYWFNGRLLMEKPLDIFLSHKEIDISFCFCWANESWTRTWYGLEKEVLMEQTYGGKADWTKHYEYLRNFFLDKRYIKVNNKPMLCIYHSHEIDDLQDMLKLFNELSVQDGFSGVYVVSGNTNSYILEERDNLVDAYYNFEPGYTLKHKMNVFEKFFYYSRTLSVRLFNKVFNKKKVERVLNAKKVYKQMLRKKEKTNRIVYPGIFPQWDNTPRRGYKGLVYKNCSPKLFEEELYRLIKNNEYPYVFLNAWNEWGEGAYLEPDEIYRFAYLEAIKKAVEKAKKE